MDKKSTKDLGRGLERKAAWFGRSSGSVSALLENRPSLAMCGVSRRRSAATAPPSPVSSADEGPAPSGLAGRNGGKPAWSHVHHGFVCQRRCGTVPQRLSTSTPQTFLMATRLADEMPKGRPDGGTKTACQRSLKTRPPALIEGRRPTSDRRGTGRASSGAISRCCRVGAAWGLGGSLRGYRRVGRPGRRRTAVVS